MKTWIKERGQAQGFLFCLADQLILLAARHQMDAPSQAELIALLTIESYGMWGAVSEK